LTNAGARLKAGERNPSLAHSWYKQSMAGDVPPWADSGEDRIILHGGFAGPFIQRIQQ
jgi:hypothetical protein